METFIPLILLTALILVQVIRYKRLCGYLSKHYPHEWQALSNNAMGTSVWSLTNANVSESLKTGFFATVEDDYVQNFIAFRRYNLYLMAVIVAGSTVLVLSGS